MFSLWISSKMFYFSVIVICSLQCITTILIVESDEPEKISKKEVCHKKHPVVLIPGLFGSRLYGHVNYTQATKPYCNRSIPYSLFWFNLVRALNFKCFSHALSLKYDAENNTMVDQDDVKLESDKFGDLVMVSTLGDGFLESKYGIYYKQIIDFLKQMGWMYNMNIKAAAYDFRKMPLKETRDVYYAKLKAMIENLREEEGCKVTIISHSMGGPVTRGFFIEQGQKWINHNTQGWVSLSGAFVGSISSIMARTYGVVNYDLTSYLKGNLQSFMATFPSMYYLQPSQDYFRPDHVVAHTDTKVFTLGNMTEFQRKVIGQTQIDMEKIGIPDIFPRSNFSIRFLCIYTSGFDTVQGARLNEDYTLNFHNVEYGPGDGLLTMSEVRSCEHVGNQMSTQTNQVIEIPGLNHSGVLKSDRVNLKIGEFLGIKPKNKL